MSLLALKSFSSASVGMDGVISVFAPSKSTTLYGGKLFLDGQDLCLNSDSLLYKLNKDSLDINSILAIGTPTLTLTGYTSVAPFGNGDMLYVGYDYVAKVSQAGALQSIFRLSVSTNAYLLSELYVTTLANGDFLITGKWCTTSVKYPILIRMNQNLDVLWAKLYGTYNTSAFPYTDGAIELPNGNIFASVHGTNNQTSFFLFSSSGTLISSSRWYSTLNQPCTATAVAVTPSNKIIVVASTVNPGGSTSQRACFVLDPVTMTKSSHIGLNFLNGSTFKAKTAVYTPAGNLYLCDDGNGIMHVNKYTTNADGGINTLISSKMISNSLSAGDGSPIMELIDNYIFIKTKNFNGKIMVYKFPVDGIQNGTYVLDGMTITITDSTVTAPATAGFAKALAESSFTDYGANITKNAVTNTVVLSIPLTSQVSINL